MIQKSTGTIHDSFFKDVFSNIQVARKFFIQVFPQNLAKQVQWESLCLSPNEWVQESLQTKRSDLIYEVKIQNRRTFLYILAEHQKNSVPEMSYRLLVYLVEIMEKHLETSSDKKPPLVFPFVFFQGSPSKKWNSVRSLHEYLEVPSILKPYIPDFSYEVFELQKESIEPFESDPWMFLCLGALKDVQREDFPNRMTERYFPLTPKVNDLRKIQGYLILFVLKFLLKQYDPILLFYVTF